MIHRFRVLWDGFDRDLEFRRLLLDTVTNDSYSQDILLVVSDTCLHSVGANDNCAAEAASSTSPSLVRLRNSHQALYQITSRRSNATVERDQRTNHAMRRIKPTTSTSIEILRCIFYRHQWRRLRRLGCSGWRILLARRA